MRAQRLNFAMVISAASRKVLAAAQIMFLSIGVDTAWFAETDSLSAEDTKHVSIVCRTRKDRKIR
jgi:hypothetical protein